MQHTLIPLILVGLATLAVADIVFPALGDWGDNGSNGKKRQQYVADIMDKWCEDRGCNFIMSTGDNFYPDGAESVDDDRFQDSWKNVYDGDSLKDLTWYMSVGNHDHSNGNEIYQLEYAINDNQWYFPYYYYGFEIEDEVTSATFYAIDSQALRKGKYDPDAQLKELDSTLADSTKDWKIVFGHHPPLSVGKRWGDETILRDVVPICQDRDVDALITGHDHNLQHIINSANPDMEHVVTGAGGKSSYAFEQENVDIINDEGYEHLFFEETYGFAGITLDNEKMCVEYFDYELEGNNPSLRKLYEFCRLKA